ncbi:MAG: bifunctional DNA-formamidopyrimidine glycosylase/DNA-(apurinic or apyrimidinic site) lyase [Acidobacteriota bacterium]|nr:bifunctional DNA-formamidopyrimidine glycosylase/DNA-(apurinic or apyrimidinic site) lyase [Acidobacteriota bacterium]
MPELPEVETVARGLASRVTGDVIESVWLGDKCEPLKSPPEEIVKTLESQRIANVRRVGKHIVIDLEPNGAGPSKAKVDSKLIEAQPHAQWIVHLGMTGRMLVCAPDDQVLKHTHAIARLKSGRELRFVDPRRFGRLSVAHEFAASGSEPLEVELEQFVKLFRGTNSFIKSALLNQKLLSGVGNIYADESLFRAGIRPRRRASSLTREELRKLYLAMRAVLKRAIKHKGSSISDYVGADGAEGFFQLQHRVYGREGKPCLTCKTPVKRVVITGRSSHYCPRCQK